MAHDLPFSVRGGSRSTARDAENSTRFALLKPVCVELLGLNSPTKERTHEQDEKVHNLLQKLHKTLLSFSPSAVSHRPLTPSLINYVFFPLGQLLRGNATGKAAGLADRIQQSLFQVLTLLATDWWRIWSEDVSLPLAPDSKQRKEHWKVWEQLLILGAVALDGTYFGKEKEERKFNSEETRLAICLFLYELLLPRTATSKVQESATAASGADWEWDGEEELPSLDQYDELENHRSSTSNKPAALHAQLYPSASHLEHIYEEKTSRGAIAHAISSVLSLSTGEGVPSPARVAALKVARIITSYWLGGRIIPAESPTALEREVEEEHRRPDTTVRSGQVFSRLKQADRVATYLPGYVSSMVRILTSKRGKGSSSVTSQALLCLSSILDICLCDEANAHILSSSSLQIAANAEDEGKKTSLPRFLEDLVEQTRATRLDSPTINEPKVEEPKSDTPDPAPQGRKKEWLDNIVSHVAIALHSIQSLTRNDSSEVQLAMLNLAHQLLTQCSSLLIFQRLAIASESRDLDVQLDAIRLLLNCVLDLAETKKNSSVVSDTAMSTLHTLLYSQLARKGVLVDAITEEMQSILMDLPRLLLSQKDEVIETAATRLSFVLRFATSSNDALVPFANRISRLAMGASKADSWGVRLLWSMKIDESLSIDRGFDSITLQGLTLRTSQSFLQVFEEIGRASARLMQQQCQAKDSGEDKSPFHIILAFMDLASRHRTTTLADTSAGTRYSRMFSQNALIVTEKMMRGVTFELDDAKLAVKTDRASRRLRKEAHRLAKGMIARVSTIWEEDEEDLLERDLHKRGESVSKEVQTHVSSDTGQTSLIERKRGLDVEGDKEMTAPALLGPALRLDFVGAAHIGEKGVLQTKAKSALQLQREAHSQIDHSDALLLGILTSSAKMLGPSVLPQLLKILYPIICGIASQSARIQSAAAQAMDELARSAGYASVQACISSHADYVLGTASHRLISTLSAELLAFAQVNEVADVHMPLVCAQSAPLVLIEVIRMLGGESLTLVQDAIDEVLDAIDRHHQQPQLCDDLLSVLDRLIDVMVNDERLKAGQQGPAGAAAAAAAQSVGRVDAGNVAFQPDVERDMAELESWWRKRMATSAQESDEPAEASSVLDAMYDGPAEDVDKDEEEEAAKASPAQAVVVSILEKAIPFLTHSSATIRIRCLRLLNRGVELLCLQGRTVEPLQVINAAWPLVMSRLGFSLSVSLRRFDKVEVPAIEDLSEREFLVCIEAAGLINTLSKHLVGYLGSEKMLRQAVPRLLLLLKIVERAEGRGKGEPSPRQHSTAATRATTFLLSPAASNAASSKKEVTSSITRGFAPIQPYTPLFTMATVVLTCLDTIVRAMGPQISEAELFAFATHPTLLACLDQRQEGTVRKAASRYYHSTLKDRNKDLVWLVLNGAKDEKDIFPAFLHRPELQLE